VCSWFAQPKIKLVENSTIHWTMQTKFRQFKTGIWRATSGPLRGAVDNRVLVVLTILILLNTRATRIQAGFLPCPLRSTATGQQSSSSPISFLGKHPVLSELERRRPWVQLISITLSSCHAGKRWKLRSALQGPGCCACQRESERVRAHRSRRCESAAASFTIVPR